MQKPTLSADMPEYRFLTRDWERESKRKPTIHRIDFTKINAEECLKKVQEIDKEGMSRSAIADLAFVERLLQHIAA